MKTQDLNDNKPEESINSGDLYREHLLKSRIPDKIELIKKKIEIGYPMSLFNKSGNGTKALLESTGRLTDFKGIFIVTTLENTHLVLGESTQVLQEIQKMSRAKRQKDITLIEKIGNEYGSKDAAQAQEFLNASNVNWIEVADKTERVILKRALRPICLFML